MKHYTPIDMTGLEIQNVRLQLLPSDPTPLGIGHTYYNSTLLAPKSWDGTGWRVLDARLVPGGSIPVSALSGLATAVQAYRLDQFAVPTADLSLGNRKITNLGAGVAGSDAVTLAQAQALADAARQGTRSKDAVNVVATTNQALSGLPTIDGVTLTAGQSVLLVAQTTSSQNGPYIVAAGAWTRRVSDDQTAELLPGSTWFVISGTTGAGTSYVLRNTTAPTVGSDPITISQSAAGSSYTAGNGVSIAGNAISVVAGTGIVSAGSVSIDTSVVVRKVSATLGDGSATTFNVTHNLNNTSPAVAVYEVSSGALVVADVIATSANAVSITFAVAPANGAFRVAIYG